MTNHVKTITTVTRMLSLLFPAVLYKAAYSVTKNIPDFC